MKDVSPTSKVIDLAPMTQVSWGKKKAINILHHITFAGQNASY